MSEGTFFILASSLSSRYFLANRDWASMNEGSYTRFPFHQVIWSYPIEGDQGCDRAHDPFDYEDDCCFSVTKVSLLRGDESVSDHRRISELLCPTSTLS
jgi:hypothetical protein